MENKKERITNILTQYADRLTCFTDEELNTITLMYVNDSRPIEIIEKELRQSMHILGKIEGISLSEETKEQTVLLIGPSGVGKTTLANKLSEKLNIPAIHLDNRTQLADIYSKERDFSYHKIFELYLITEVLTGIKGPAIIDFGAGHSIQDNHIIFKLLKN